MRRDYRVCLDDILEASVKIRTYSTGLTFEEFRSDPRTVDAVIRNLTVIGEAARSLPENVREKYPHVAWQDTVGLRNVLVHRYFGIDLEVIWRVIQTDVGLLEGQVREILAQEG